MRLKLGALTALVAVSAACVVRSSGGDPSTGSITAPIEGGDPINQKANPVTSLFPRSTVYLETPHDQPDGTMKYEGCTGEVLTPTKILTAAHCGLTDETKVYFYPTTPGASALPLKTAATTISASGPPAVQKGAEACDLNVTLSCYSNTPSTHYADLAVVPLVSSVPPAYTPVVLGPKGSFAASHPDDSRAPSSWAVGTGLMNVRITACAVNAATENAERAMQWVPMYHLPPSDLAGTFNTVVQWGDHGDSGGPIYELAPGPAPSDPRTYNLILVAVLSGGKPSECLPDNLGEPNYNIYTSVEYGDNYDWLIAQGAAGAVTTKSLQTFGAAL